MSISTVRNDLKTYLSTQPWIAGVYDYPEENLLGYPAVMIDSAGFDNMFNDTSRNMTTFVFDLYVFLSMGGTKTEQQVRQQMDDMYDNLLQLFNSQIHFSGAIKAEPITAERPSVVDRPSPMMMGKFVVRFTYLTVR